MGIREIFKENLKFYRQKAGFTQEQLSEKIGYGIGYISEIESRQIFPKPETIDKIAQELNICSSLLFDNRASPKNVQTAFNTIYGEQLEIKLKNKINSAIEEVCKLV